MFKRLIPVMLLALTLGGCATIGTGHRGVVLNYGHPTGEVKPEGFYFLNPFAQHIAEMNVQQVTDEVDIVASTSDNQPVKTKVAVTYSLDPTKVVSVYDQVLDDYQARWVSPAAQADTKGEIAHYQAQNLNQQRAAIQNKIDSDLRASLASKGISVAQVLITGDFEFSDTFTQAVENKVKAQQDLLTAQIDAQRAITKARAEAASQQSQHQSLTPALLQKEALDKWDGHLPQVVGNGGIPFINVKQ